MSSLWWDGSNLTFQNNELVRCDQCPCGNDDCSIIFCLCSNGSEVYVSDATTIDVDSAAQCLGCFTSQCGTGAAAAQLTFSCDDANSELDVTLTVTCPDDPSSIGSDTVTISLGDHNSNCELCTDEELELEFTISGCTFSIFVNKESFGSLASCGCGTLSNCSVTVSSPSTFAEFDTTAFPSAEPDSGSNRGPTWVFWREYYNGQGGSSARRWLLPNTDTDDEKVRDDCWSETGTVFRCWIDGVDWPDPVPFGILRRHWVWAASGSVCPTNQVSLRYCKFKLKHYDDIITTPYSVGTRSVDINDAARCFHRDPWDFPPGGPFVSVLFNKTGTATPAGGTADTPTYSLVYGTHTFHTFNAAFNTDYTHQVILTQPDRDLGFPYGPGNIQWIVNGSSVFSGDFLAHASFPYWTGSCNSFGMVFAYEPDQGTLLSFGTNTQGNPSTFRVFSPHASDIKTFDVSDVELYAG